MCSKVSEIQNKFAHITMTISKKEKNKWHLNGKAF